MSNYRKIDIFQASEQGRREENEDVEIVMDNLNSGDHNSCDLMGIFDGHGGRFIAEKSAEYLRKYLMKMSYCDDNVDDEIIDLYRRVQNQLINKYPNKSNEQGSTALTVIRYIDKKNKERLKVINLGDCRAVISRNGRINVLTKDHKPNWPDEKKRINEINNGIKNKRDIYVEHYQGEDPVWRVGDLSVSRAFGDTDNSPHVSAVPEIFDYSIGNEEFIIMACDGLWDVISNEMAVNFVKDHLEDNDPSTYYTELNIQYNRKMFKGQNIAKILANYAISKGSTDNVSVIIIVFDNKKNVE